MVLKRINNSFDKNQVELKSIRYNFEDDLSVLKLGIQEYSKGHVMRQHCQS